MVYWKIPIDNNAHEDTHLRIMLSVPKSRALAQMSYTNLKNQLCQICE